MLIKKIAKASVITVIFTLLFLVLSVIIQSLIGRIYGPSGLGLYASFMMFIGLYSMFAIFGIPAALSKYIAEYDEKQKFSKIRESFSSALIFATLTSLGIGLLGYYITPYLASAMHLEAPSKMSLFILIALISFVYSQISQSFFRGLLDALKSSFIQIIPFLGILCIVLYAYFFNLIPVYHAIVLGYFLSGVIGMLLCIKENIITVNISRGELYKILKFGLPVALMSYFVFVSQWIDRITLGVYLGVMEIGIFTAGLVIVNAIRQVPLSLNPILIPAYSKINVYGKESVERAFNLNVKLASIFLFLMGSLVFLYADAMVFLLFGSDFNQTIIILKILSIQIFLSAITLPTSTLIMGIGYPKLNMYLSFVGVPIRVLLVILLTKYYGIWGTAIANVLSGVLFVFGSIFISSRVLRIKLYWENLVRPSFGWILFILSFLFVFNIFNNSILAGVTGIAAYAFFCWKKVLSTADRDLIREIGG